MFEEYLSENRGIYKEWSEIPEKIRLLALGMPVDTFRKSDFSNVSKKSFWEMELEHRKVFVRHHEALQAVRSHGFLHYDWVEKTWREKIHVPRET